MKACFLAKMYFLNKKVLTSRGGGRRKQRENAAAGGFPHFSGQSEPRLKASEEKRGHFSSLQFILATLVRLYCILDQERHMYVYRVNFIQLFSIFRE